MSSFCEEDGHQIIVFEDENRDQTVLLEVTNRFARRMRFGWETSFGFVFRVSPCSGIMEPGEKKSFEIHFNGSQLINTECMDSDHAIRLIWTPAETRKRGLEDTKLEVPIYFGVHVQPKCVMEFS